MFYSSDAPGVKVRALSKRPPSHAKLPTISAVRRAIIYRTSRGLAPGYRATRERLSAYLFIGRPQCEGAGADPAHDASKVGEIAVVKRVAEHVLQEIVVALAGLPGH